MSGPSYILITVERGEISFSVFDNENDAEASLIQELETNYSDISIPNPYNQADISEAIEEADIDYLFLIQEIMT
jgi:hypothetical protein